MIEGSSSKALKEIDRLKEEIFIKLFSILEIKADQQH